MVKGVFIYFYTISVRSNKLISFLRLPFFAQFVHKKAKPKSTTSAINVIQQLCIEVMVLFGVPTTKKFLGYFSLVINIEKYPFVSHGYP
jgi:hypothetical protein